MTGHLPSCPCISCVEYRKAVAPEPKPPRERKKDDEPVKEDEVYASAVALLVLGVTLVLVWPLRAWAMVTCWTWFAVPLGMPAIGWAHAYGLACLVHLWHGGYPVPQQDQRKKTGEENRAAIYKGCINALAIPASVFGMAWVCHYFMVNP